MERAQIIPLLIYVVIVMTYLWFSTKFKKGWATRCIAVKGGRINVLLFVFIVFVALIVIVRTTL
jgi:hypothetical protein